MPSIESRLAQQAMYWRCGNPITIEELIGLEGRNEDSMSTHDAWLNLICNEVRLREELGETPTLEEYQLRYPHLAIELKTQVRLYCRFAKPAVRNDHGGRTSNFLKPRCARVLAKSRAQRRKAQPESIQCRHG